MTIDTKEELSASEALFGFCGWLTGRTAPVTFSACHGAATAAELVQEFIEVNNLSEPRDDWHMKLVHPPEPKPIEITPAAFNTAIGRE